MVAPKSFNEPAADHGTLRARRSGAQRRSDPCSRTTGRRLRFEPSRPGRAHDCAGRPADGGAAGVAPRSFSSMFPRISTSRGASPLRSPPSPASPSSPVRPGFSPRATTAGAGRPARACRCPSLGIASGRDPARALSGPGPAEAPGPPERARACGAWTNAAPISPVRSSCGAGSLPLPLPLPATSTCAPAGRSPVTCAGRCPKWSSKSAAIRPSPLASRSAQRERPATLYVPPQSPDPLKHRRDRGADRRAAALAPLPRR